MGSCCTKADTKAAYKSELGAPLLRDVLLQLPEHTSVINIKVNKAYGFPSISKFTDTAEPYIEMRIRPGDMVAGEQVKCTSKRPQTIEPKWEPAEKFQFIVANLMSTKLVVSVYHFNGTSDPDPLGDGTLALKDLTQDESPYSVQLINPNTGKPGGIVEVEAFLQTAIEASNTEEHVVMEFQRWDRSAGWGPTLNSSDPGRWSTANGTRFEKDFESIIPDIPEGWVVLKSWTTVSTTSDFEGWQYAASFDSTDWFPTEQSGCYLRRRTWVRVIHKPAATASQPDKKRSSTMKSFNFGRSISNVSNSSSTSNNINGTGSVASTSSTKNPMTKSDRLKGLFKK